MNLIEIIGEEIGKLKLFYHGRKMGGRPYSGTYIFITDNLGYASGYSDGKELYTYTIPFSMNKIFSIRNPKHLNMLKQYVDENTIREILKASPQEMDWAALSYISTDDFEDASDLFIHMGFYGVSLTERQDILSIYVFDESKLVFQGKIDITSPEMINKIKNYYVDFTRDKNFL